MKKNYFLRAAVLMLVLCTLMSGVFMGTGTMAKYIAAGEGAAEAHVAKFSVKVVGQGHTANTDAQELATKTDGTAMVLAAKSSKDFFSQIFNAAYKAHDTTYGTTNDSVVSKNGTGLLVAPGTTNELTPAPAKIKVWNESEVAVRIRAQLVGVIGIGGGGESATVHEVPLQVKNSAGNYVAVGTVTSSGLLNTPIDLISSIDLPPNQDGTTVTTGYSEFDGIFWKWVFDGADSAYSTDRTGVTATGKLFSDTDIFDTALGIHGVDNAKFQIRITAEQID